MWNIKKMMQMNLLTKLIHKHTEKLACTKGEKFEGV